MAAEPRDAGASTVIDAARIGRVFREESGRAVAALIGVLGDIDLAEDAVQDAFAIALRRWPDEGLPPNPGGWITTTARNQAIDRLRRDSRGRELLAELALLAPGDDELGTKEDEEGPVEDDRLRLIFTCCHAGVIVGVAVALGYRPDAGLPGTLAAIALVVAFAFGLSWGFAAVGLLMRAPNAVSSAGSMALFPLVFLSNVFVEPKTLPGWLETFVDVSPISHLVTAARGLMDGTVPGLELTVSLGTAALLTAVFAPLTTYLYAWK